MSQKVPNYQPSTIETIDGAFLDYVEGLNLFSTTINGFEKVPVIWSSAERAYQIKNNREIRDKNGSLIPPIISIERTSTTKDPQKKGSFQSNVSPRHDRFVYTQRINQDKTSNFANADTLKKSGQINFKTSKRNEKIVYKFVSIPIPVYVTIEYKINIITNYQTQMNEIIQPFMSRTAQNYFVITKDGHKYECFMDQNFQQDPITDLGENERKYKSTITVKTLGYLIGEGNNQEKPQSTEQENAVEVKFPRENLFLMGEEDKRTTRKRATNEGIQISSGLLSKKIFIFGNTTDEIYNLTHNYNTKDLIVRIRDNSDDTMVEATISFVDNNTIQIDVGYPPGNDAFTAMIVG